MKLTNCYYHRLGAQDTDIEDTNVEDSSCLQGTGYLMEKTRDKHLLNLW